MSPEDFDRRLGHDHQRIGDLTEAESTGAEETIEELRAALEELRVADEELRAQNEELAAAHPEVEAERRRYQELFQLAPDAYIVTNLAGMIAESNQTASRLLGIRNQFLTGKALAAYVELDDRPRFRALLSQPDQSEG